MAQRSEVVLYQGAGMMYVFSRKWSIFKLNLHPDTLLYRFDRLESFLWVKIVY
jgi:hypothetical protein